MANSQDSNREVILDTETTGLAHQDGHRIIELAATELFGTIRGRTFHHYFNPERPIDEGATAVHGIRNADVADAPRFGELAEDFLNFCADSPIIAHNSNFDKGFVNSELRHCKRGWGKFYTRESGGPRWIDTLAIARKKRAGRKNTLDALAKDFGISEHASRGLHGAAKDVDLLIRVYMRLSGRQDQLEMEGRARIWLPGREGFFFLADGEPPPHPGPRPASLPPSLSKEEAAAHRSFMARLKLEKEKEDERKKA